MNRKDFLKSIGFGLLGISVVTVINSCGNDSNTSASQSVDFTININDYPALKSVGGSSSKDGVVIARTTTTSFVAVSQKCTHEGNPIGYTGTNFHCPTHGSTFSTSGQVITGPATKNLQIYTTTFNDPILRVKS